MLGAPSRATAGETRVDRRHVSLSTDLLITLAGPMAEARYCGAPCVAIGSDAAVIEAATWLLAEKLEQSQAEVLDRRTSRCR